MLFKYKGIDASGRKVKSTIEAVSLDAAKSKLKVKNVLYTKIKPTFSHSLSRSSFRSASQINPLTLSYLSRDLSIYLKSGISLVKAIKLLALRYKKNKKLGAFFESISSSLDEGKSFYTAIEVQKALKIPEFYKQSIKISENGGLLEVVLLELAQFLKEQDRIKKQMSSAMAYPLFILFVSVLMVGFMLSVIVPKITSIFTQFDKELPTSTAFVIKLGEFFSNNYMILLISLISFIVIFILLLNKSKPFKYFIDSILLKIPFINSLIELNELSRFSYMNSILIRSGIPIVQSIKLSANILKNTVIQKVFETASSKVVEGEKLSKILDTSKTYKVDTSFVHAIAIGEETSELSSILNNLADLYNESNKDKITIFLALLEPVMMLVVGSIIGFIVLAMLMPIFSMNLG